ncbi:sirohydrochlorin chelatase [Eleftheria terrae]|uniref:sirohydrochlorin chelatase n=1 Tax=Eleftheria terrae TaxID=1597781 RepID=UPI00263B860A|nr:CbiX/SirB N-terminal domain-containing protein [Eleftheria terrae]WKB52943.1 CbiX/SirB N-terminal domain-containing protein [Eleftheria terrae]
MDTGILLFAHGARDPHWAQPFEAVAARLRTLAPGAVVELAFLEFMAPTLEEAGSRLVTAGCTQVSVVPLFLGAGGHVRKDLPALLQSLAGRHPAVRWNLQPAVGETDEVVQAMAASALRLSLPQAHENMPR